MAKSNKRQGWTVDDRPYVKKQAGGKTRDIEHMLKLFSKRIHKNGKLQEYRERQHYTPPAAERREEKNRIEYKLDKVRKEMKEEAKISGTR